MATFEEFYKSFPKDDQERGDFFEKKFAPWFLKNDPQLSAQIKKVWIWEEYPKRWRDKECGIDLVYEDIYGRDWAVQAKCYSPKYYIKKDDVDSFLSESGRKSIFGRLLLATTNLVGANAKQVIEGQEKQIFSYLLKDFKKSQIIFPNSPEELKKAKRKKIFRPHGFQNEVILETEKYLKNNDRGQIIMACGTGKTLTALWIHEKLRSKKTLFLVPSLYLVNQVLIQWVNNRNENFEWICICSDESVKKNKKNNSQVENSIGISNPVTNNLEEIKSFLNRKEKQVIFCTYHSSKLLVEAQKDLEIKPFDITFADEAHRCTKDAKKVFGNIVKENSIRSKKRIFMTATPISLSDKIKEKAIENNIEFYSMDIKKQFGDVIHKISFRDAILLKPQMLTEYKVIVVAVDQNPKTFEKIKKRSFLTTDGEDVIDAENLANHAALGKTIKEENLQKIITFHHRVAWAEEFAKNHVQILKNINEGYEKKEEIICESIDGEMTIAQRSNVLENLEFKDEKKRVIISNARCLTEGIDIPSLDGIAFIDSKSSEVDIIQAIGRVIRFDEGKKFGTILIPVYLEEKENINNQIIQTRFAKVWQILNSLKYHDDYLSNEIDQLRIEIGKRKKPSKKRKGIEVVHWKLPEWVPKDFYESLDTLLIKNTSDDWYEKYGKLEEYLELNNGIMPIEGHSTYHWILRQRRLNKLGYLAPEREELLNDLIPKGWYWDPLEDKWYEMYYQLKDYFQSHPDRRAIRKNAKLSKWVQHQRENYRKGTLSKSRIDLLDSLEMWCWDVDDAVWKDQLNEVREFDNINGHIFFKDHRSSIYKWLRTEYSKYLRKKLEPQREKDFKTINSLWMLEELNELWYSKFERLFNYLSAGNEILDLNDKQIYRWSNLLIEDYQNKTLSKNIIQLFKKIPNWKWEKIDRLKYVNDKKWEENFQKLRIFESLNQHTFPDIKKDIKLHGWCVSQRLLFKRGKLEKDREEKLNTLITWVWDSAEEAWDNQFAEFQKYLAVFKSSNNISKDCNPKTRKWVYRQREHYRKGILSERRIKRLETIEDWEW